MRSSTVALCLAAAGSIGCGSTPPPPVVATLVVPPPDVAPPPASAAAPSGPPAADAPIPMYPVARIYSLFDLTATEGGIELRLGLDPGGGVSGIFRFVPLVDGAPDFEHETRDLRRAYTSGGFMELVGKRPNLVYHRVEGFQSPMQDSYETLDPESTLGPFKPASIGVIGNGIFPWSKGRLLEWRGPQPEALAGASGAVLPHLRVLYGSDREAPSVPKGLQAQLTKAWFVVATLTAFRTGEVVAAGWLMGGKGFGTLIWRDDLKQPLYVVTETVPVKAMESEVGILGGTSLADVRLQVDDKVLRLEGSAWVVESTVEAGALPDVWFGSTSLRTTQAGTFARIERGAPWRRIAKVEAGEPHVAVDPSGVIWKTEGELLLSSKPPARPLLELTEHDLVQLRKASVLRGGYDDETGAPPDAWRHGKCRMSYVLLDQAAVGGAAPADYPLIRAALKGHPELGAARFVVSREKRAQLFGALVRDEAVAGKLADLVKKRVKSSPALRMCAEPAVVREIKIDLGTGALIE